MGIEPTLLAWEARVLPLNYTRIKFKLFSSHFSSIEADLPLTICSTYYQLYSGLFGLSSGHRI